MSGFVLKTWSDAASSPPGNETDNRNSCPPSARFAGAGGAGYLGFLGARLLGTATIATTAFSQMSMGALGAARSFAGMLTPLSATLLALGSIYIAYDRINAALEEKNELEARNKNNEEISRYLELTSQAVSRYRGAINRGEKDGIAAETASEQVDKFTAKLESLGALKSAAAMRGYRDRLRDGTYGKGAKTTADGSITPEDFIADPVGAVRRMQEQLAVSQSKTTNMKVDANFSVDVKGDPNASTGLKASEVAELAQRAARSVFSMEILRVAEGGL